MASQAEKYRAKNSELTDAFFNSRFLDIDLRLVGLEQVLSDFGGVRDTLVARGLEQINAQVQASVTTLLEAVTAAQGQFDEQLEVVGGAVESVEAAVTAAEAAVQDLQAAIDAILASGTLPAVSVTVSAIAGVTATTVQGALAEHQTDIEAKADASAVTAALALKADASALAAKADGSAVTAALALKADASALAAKADASAVTAALALKADAAATTAALALKAASSHAHTIGDLPKAGATEFRAGTDDTKFLTTKAVYDAAAIVGLTDGATITSDFATGINFGVTLAGNRALANPSNIKVGQSGSYYITQDATGSRTLSYGSNFKWPGGTAGVLSTAANAVDCLHYKARTTTFIEVSLVKDVK